MDTSTKEIQPYVSVIIPTYNAEEYLHACLDSATQQTLKNIEIICVDDCSSDGSLKIIEEYAVKDKRIRRLSHDKNRGEGASRNTGIDQALGKYIFHLDADDTIPPDAIECLYSSAKLHGSELVKGTFIRIDSSGNIGPLHPRSKVEKIVNTNIYETQYLQTIPGSHCSYLYERNVLVQHNIRYATDLKVSLDLVMLAEILVKTNKVTLIPDTAYHYHQTGESATRGELDSKVPLNAIEGNRRIDEILNTAGLQKAATAYKQRWSWQIRAYWTKMALNYSQETCSAIFTNFRSLVTNTVPWKEDTPMAHRYLLSLILAELDQEAVGFLRGPEIHTGFFDLDILKNRLNFILSIFPNDLETLYNLAGVLREQGDLEGALLLFDKVLLEDSKHLDSLLQLSGTLRSLDRMEDANNSLLRAKEVLRNSDNPVKIIKQLVNQKDCLSYEEKKLVNYQFDQNIRQINSVRKELNSAYISRSWRLTLPLRKIWQLKKIMFWIK